MLLTPNKKSYAGIIINREGVRVTDPKKRLDIKGLVINGFTWYWAPQNLKGNTIDFFMTLEAKTFTDTMQILCPKDGKQAASAPKDPGRNPRPVACNTDRGHRPYGEGCLPDPNEEDDEE